MTTTAADLTRYAQAILAGTAPGVSALDPQWAGDTRLPGNNRVGLAWMSSGPGGSEVQWHNGGTGGTRTILAIDRHTQTAAIILNSSKTDVTGAGLRLAGADGGPPRFLVSLSERDYYWVLGLVPVVLCVPGALRGRSRLGQLVRITWALGGLLLIWLAGPWNWVPGCVFGASTGVTVAALIVIGLRWQPLPWRHRWFLWLIIPTFALTVAFFVLMVSVLVRVIGAD